MSKISVKFLIDDKEKRVVFAEAESDFIDVLFSFLTLPMGKIVRLLGKQSGLGSLDSLYNSVQKLDIKNMHTEECKEMLLNPRSDAAIICEDLQINNIHDEDPRRFYACKDCSSQYTCYYTYTLSGQCRSCGKVMVKHELWPKEIPDKGGIFVNDISNFIITDDLRVIPTSLMRGCSLVEEYLRNKDGRVLKERVVLFGRKEVLDLLRRSFVSKSAFKEIFFVDSCVQRTDCSFAIKEEINVIKAKSEITLNLVLNKKSNHVLYAESGGDFVNQLLSFLTFPLGSVLTLLSDNVSVLDGCIRNLYSSAKSLNCFKSEIYKNMVLKPKLAAFYGFRKQILKLEENTSKTLKVPSCANCYFVNGHKPCFFGQCNHENHLQSEIKEQDPKSGKSPNIGGDFVVDSRMFMISDNLCISPLSFISSRKNLMNLPISDLVEKNVCLDKAKVLLLLSTMLISKTVLTDIFCPKATRTKIQFP